MRRARGFSLVEVMLATALLATGIVAERFWTLRRKQVLPAGLGERCAELNEIAVELALLARDETGAKVVVAGSIAPTCFCSEPREGYLRHDQALVGYRFQAEVLRLAAYTFWFDSGRAEAELGYRNRPLDETLADAVAWMRRSD